MSPNGTQHSLRDVLPGMLRHDLEVSTGHYSGKMANSTAPHLSSPMSLGNLTLRNRNIMSSLTRSRSFPDAVPNEYNIEYYTQRAKGGAGLILTEGTLVSQQGTEWPGAPGIWNEDQVNGWRKVTDSVHKVGGVIFCQPTPIEDPRTIVDEF
ncbi:hypothetical protein PHLCEN_2v10858 [Hermanssonia centrifuga]|uniref:NADH:flavin oxidoreductase/NADH oxidase N-terminal domain-containing protein n=1 Tax=Hermanssonia centrifuga TaxID=98765 RepID=A0A2R6NLL6_9APHY|nr:hypothetical protein PHLCEN_2v10858 [Hermanssonia centrifuga]